MIDEQFLKVDQSAKPADEIQPIQPQPAQTNDGKSVEEKPAVSIPVSDLPEEEKLKRKLEAILAMEGEEGRLKRERAEKEKMESDMVSKLDSEKAEINKKLSEISKKKEEYELKWVDITDKKGSIKQILDPIIESETNLEKNEQSKNQEEHATEDVRQRQALEKERQEISQQREKTEKDKWLIEDKILELDETSEKNKKEYQLLIDEEYSLLDKVKEIDKKIESIKK